MANDFKRFCTPNVSNSSNTTIYAVPAGAGSAALESIVIGITMANKTSSGITASIFIDNQDGSNDVFIGNAPIDNSLVIFVGRLAIHETEDYAISGTTVTFAGDLASGGASPIAEGDEVYVKYQK